MGDPTFSCQFALAVQEDILRDIARHPVHLDEDAIKVCSARMWLARLVRRLTGTLSAPLNHGSRALAPSDPHVN